MKDEDEVVLGSEGKQEIDNIKDEDEDVILPEVANVENDVLDAEESDDQIGIADFFHIFMYNYL